MRVILSEVHLDQPCSLERGMSMSTLIASEEWHLETHWNGLAIGDVMLYRDKTMKGVKGPYWGSVPHSRIKCYRFKGDEPNVEQEQVAGATSARSKQAATA